MTLSELIAVTATVALGSVIQAASGVGAGFLMVPLLAWINLELVPGPVIFGSIFLSALMAWKERAAIDRENLPAIFLGLIGGAFLGAWILSVVPSTALGIVFGVTILLAVLVTASGLDVPLNQNSALLCGAISGAMGASSGIGAPMLAILYQHSSGARVRATLAFLYTGASILILIMLAIFGKFGPAQARDGAMMIPGFLLGYWLVISFRGKLARFGSRGPILVISALAAVLLLGRSLVN